MRMILCTTLTMLVIALSASIVASFVPANRRFTRRLLASPSTSTIQPTQFPHSEDTIIHFTDRAKKHLESLKKNNKELYLRMGVRSGGCSGMSYVMDVVDPSSIAEEDQVVDCDDVKCIVDPKSLLYLYGLQLDYSDELIGGGFKFQNPNAETSCGCGKSFGV